MTYKARKRLKQKAYLKKRFDPSSLTTEEDEAELERKAEKIAELAGFCGTSQAAVAPLFPLLLFLFVFQY